MVATKHLIHASLLIALTVAQVWAQQGDTRIDTQVRSGTNPQVGSNGYNTAIQPSFLANHSDLYITGNITGGRSFQAFSPVAAGTAFRASLPSASLSRFERDSISYQDIAAGRSQALPSPYYSRSRTATTYGTLSAGFNTFGGVPSTAFHARPARSPAYALPRYGIPYAPDWSQTALSSETKTQPLAVPLPPISTYAQPVPLVRDQTQAASWPAWLSTARSQFQPGLARQPMDRVLPTDLLAPSRVSALANGQVVDPVYYSGMNSPLAPTDALPPDDQVPFTTSFHRPSETRLPLTWLPSHGPTLADIAADTYAGGSIPQFQATGHDPLADFQSAYLFITRVTQREAQIMAALEGRTDDKEQYEHQLQNAWQLFAEPVSTFVNTANPSAQQYLRDAESLVRDGKYYQARAKYEQARTLDRQNPLILLGLGHALLAAGEYYTAALMVSRAVEMFPAMAYLQFDLRQFIPQADLLEIRRADLERRLEEKENLRFRFLLGYAEFYSGLPQFGMPNLQRAAQDAPQHSGMARLYQILQQKKKSDQE